MGVEEELGWNEALEGAPFSHRSFHSGLQSMVSRERGEEGERGVRSSLRAEEHCQRALQGEGGRRTVPSISKRMPDIRMSRTILRVRII